MTGVDDRIVAMQFDNDEFARRVGSTLKDIDSLKKSLDFSSSQRNMSALESAGNSFNMGHMAESVEGISKKFLALTTVGITTLATLTEHAVMAGARMLKSFTIAPIQAGFGEFETKLGSIQTILANTARYGTQLPEVTANLDKLNTYADKTIYSFGDMTKNIGLFTNAGIKIDDATSMIKGFSNSAAASGTNAEGAASAAYQLSQALSTGTVKLMDWKSLTNVGMGNKNMQDALVSIADKMGTVSKAGTNVKDVQGNFNASLEKGWLSADVMSTYLKIMAGDMDDTKIKALGFSDAQVKAFRAQQITAEEAATKVRTFTQLVGTIKEAVGSGWAKTFETVLGNFNESTELFTEINGAIGSFVEHSADARNNLLQGWKDLGGRTVLIQGFRDAIKAVGDIIAPIKEAFSDFFPSRSAKQLFGLTQGFAELMHAMIPSVETIMKIRRVANGFFSIFDIGREILHNVVNIFLTLGSNIQRLGAGGGMIDLILKLADGLFTLDKYLVGQNKIGEFVSHIQDGINKLFDLIIKIKEHLGDLDGIFDMFSGAKGKIVEDSVDRLNSRFGLLAEVGHRLSDAWHGLSGIMDGVKQVLGNVVGYIGTWLSELGHNMAAALGPEDFNGVVDIINVGLLGGIIVMFRKFINNGFKLDIGDGLIEKVKDALGGVTGTLKAMQAELKAKALMEIAIALGVLTASIVVLSLIDSAALAKALTAMTIGFGELLGAMTALGQIAGSAKDAVKLDIVAGGLTLLAGAMLIMSVAVKVMSTLSWEELLKGLGGMGVSLGLLVGAMQLMSTDAAGLIAGGVAMIAISTGLTILAGAVKLFATMSWVELAKGLVGVAFGLGIIVGITNTMSPLNLLATGAAMIPLATGLLILAGAVDLMGHIPLGTMAKGIGGIAVVLLILNAAMETMPLNLPITAVGLVILSGALVIMAGAVKLMGSQSIGTLAKGIGAFAVMLLILGAALEVMQSAAGGAAALIVTAVAMGILAKVLKTLGEMSIKELAIGIGAIAAVLLVLGGAAALMQPIIPAMVGLGVALGLIGGAFALFGVGAYLVAKAFEAMAKAGEAGMKAIIGSIVMFIKAIPMFVGALISSLVQSAQEFLQAGTTLLKVATVFLLQLLDTVIKLAPKIAEAIAAIIDAAVVLLWTRAPMLIATGIMLLMTLLGGIDSHIVDITNKAIEIVVKFAQTLSNNAEKLIDAAVDLLMSFIKAIGDRAADIAGAGLTLLLAFIGGIADNIIKVVDKAGEIIAKFVGALGGGAAKIVTAGGEALVHFLEGVAGNISKVAEKATDVAIAFVDAVGSNAVRFANAAGDALVNFLNGLAEAIRTHTDEIRQAGVNIAGAMIDGMTGGLASRAGDVAKGAVGVAKGAVGGIMNFIESKSPSKLFFRIAGFMTKGMAQGFDHDVLAENSAVASAENIVRAFQETLEKAPTSLSGLDVSPVIRPVLDLTRVRAGAKGLGQLITVSPITPEVSFSQARVISTTSDLANRGTPEPVRTGPAEVKFEQNIYSPTALQTGDIYRQTKSQIVKAKEELDI